MKLGLLRSKSVSCLLLLCIAALLIVFVPDVRRFDAQMMPLEGSSGLLFRVQRLLESSAPRVDERRKKQLLDRFTKVVKQGS